MTTERLVRWFAAEFQQIFVGPQAKTASFSSKKEAGQISACSKCLVKSVWIAPAASMHSNPDYLEAQRPHAPWSHAVRTKLGPQEALSKRAWPKTSCSPTVR